MQNSPKIRRKEIKEMSDLLDRIYIDIQEYNQEDNRRILSRYSNEIISGKYTDYNKFFTLTLANKNQLNCGVTEQLIKKLGIDYVLLLIECINGCAEGFLTWDSCGEILKTTTSLNCNELAIDILQQNGVWFKGGASGKNSQFKYKSNRWHLHKYPTLKSCYSLSKNKTSKDIPELEDNVNKISLTIIEEACRAVCAITDKTTALNPLGTISRLLERINKEYNFGVNITEIPREIYKHKELHTVINKYNIALLKYALIILQTNGLEQYVNKFKEILNKRDELVSSSLNVIARGNIERLEIFK